MSARAELINLIRDQIERHQKEHEHFKDIVDKLEVELQEARGRMVDEETAYSTQSIILERLKSVTEEFKELTETPEDVDAPE